MGDLARAAQGVLLDMDGTLIDTEVVYFASTVGAMVTLGYRDAVDICHRMIGIPGPECEMMLLEEYGADFPISSFNEAFVAHRDAELGRGLSLKVGADKLVQALCDAGSPRAIVTSSSRKTAEKHLALVGIRSQFDLIVTRDDVLRGKPAPDLYVLAARHLGLQPENCIAIEDSNPGVAAANAAGVPVIMVPDVLPPSAATERMGVPIMRDLNAVLDTLRNNGTLPNAAERP
jgi:HAD superfamily hydrolase (TIGR01509 family)